MARFSVERKYLIAIVTMLLLFLMGIGGYIIYKHCLSSSNPPKPKSKDPTVHPVEKESAKEPRPEERKIPKAGEKKSGQEENRLEAEKEQEDDFEVEFDNKRVRLPISESSINLKDVTLKKLPRKLEKMNSLKIIIFDNVKNFKTFGDILLPLQLRALKITNTAITSLPKNLKNLTRLEYLYLHKIETPLKIEHLLPLNIEILGLDGKFSTAGIRDFTKFPKLREVKISLSRDEKIKLPKNVKRLDLLRTPGKLPEFDTPSGLKTLNFSADCNIKDLNLHSLPETTTELSFDRIAPNLTEATCLNLHTLRLRNISVGDDNLQYPIHLRELDIADCIIKRNFSIPKVLRKLNLVGISGEIPNHSKIPLTLKSFSFTTSHLYQSLLGRMPALEYLSLHLDPKCPKTDNFSIPATVKELDLHGIKGHKFDLSSLVNCMVLKLVGFSGNVDFSNGLKLPPNLTNITFENGDPSSLPADLSFLGVRTIRFLNMANANLKRFKFPVGLSSLIVDEEEDLSGLDDYFKPRAVKDYALRRYLI